MTSICCCCRSRLLRLQQVAPNRDSQDDINSYLEIRPKRWLNIYHVNARPRDARFCRELQLASSHGEYKYPVAKRAHVTPAEKLTLATQGQDLDRLHLPNTVTHRADVIKTPDTSCSSPQYLNTSMKISQDPEVIVDKKNIHQLMDLSIDRGHSAGSVALSLMSRQSCVPSPQGSVSPFISPPRNPQRCGKESESVINAKCDPVNSKAHPQSADTNEKDAVLFFIHGVGGSSDTWKAQVNYFTAQGYEIVAPDLIGHGFSMAPDKKKAYHFEEISKDLEAVFDKFCKRRNVIIAHSYGCSFATVLARKRSRRVTKIVLISGGGPTPLAPQPGVFSLPTCLLICVRPCLDCGFKKSAFHKTSKVHSPKDQAFDIPTYVLSHTMNGQQWMEGDRVFHNWLNVATLLVYGKHDKLVTLEEEKIMEETIYGSRLEVVDAASHMVMIEQPDIVNSLIHNFLLSDLRIAGHTDDSYS